MRQLKKIIVVMVAVSLMLVFVPVLSADDGNGSININTATADELIVLKQVGSKLAERIVKFREDNGPFQVTEDIMKVSGIGQKVYNANRDIITVK